MQEQQVSKHIDPPYDIVGEAKQFIRRKRIQLTHLLIAFAIIAIIVAFEVAMKTYYK